MGAMISTAELATIKGCTPRYIRQLAQTGKLPFTEKADAANNRKRKTKISLKNQPFFNNRYCLC